MEWGKVLLLLLALGISWGSPCCGAQQIKTTSIKKRTFTLPSNCPTSCGNISIQYPFGIGNGCYLPGFNLTCFEQSVPPRLFMGDGTLEVTSIDLRLGYVYFQSPVISMGVNQPSITAPLMDLQNYHNFNFWGTDNFLFVSGCNVNASLVDFTNNNTIIDYCSTICLDVLPLVIRDCRIDIPDSLFLGVRLTRLDGTQLQLANATAVSAYMRTSSYWSSLIRNWRPRLSWYMDDHSSCTEAMKDMGTYPCISSNSECQNAFVGDRNGTVGYYCRCSGATEGNPYLTDGCKDVTTANIHPAKNCTRKCGSVDIPFPFGLDNESDCYRDSTFALSCKETTPPVLQFEDMNVIDIDTEMGELQLTIVGLNVPYWWYIPYDSSCENARMNKSLFACVSEHVTCRNINGSKGDRLGYRCGCEKGYTGNPYIKNGCQGLMSTDVTTANIHPADNCTRKCGSIDVPFPFGLDNESDCYRDSSFALSCKETTTPPVLQYDQDKIVTHVDVESGEVHLEGVTTSSQVIILTEGQYIWFIPYHSCENAKRNKSRFACVSEHVTCRDMNGSKGDRLGYRCGCEKGYTGNPYIKNGCQGIYLKTLPS